MCRILTILPCVLIHCLFVFGSRQEWIVVPHWKWWLWKWSTHWSLSNLLVCYTWISGKWRHSSIVSLHRWSSALWPHSTILRFQFRISKCVFLCTRCSGCGKVGISSAEINLSLIGFSKALEHPDFLFSGKIFDSSWCCQSCEFFKPTDTLKLLELINDFLKLTLVQISTDLRWLRPLAWSNHCLRQVSSLLVSCKELMAISMKLKVPYVWIYLGMQLHHKSQLVVFQSIWSDTCQETV